MRWFGHTERINEHRIAKQIYELRMSVGRRKERLRKSWNGCNSLKEIDEKFEEQIMMLKRGIDMVDARMVDSSILMSIKKVNYLQQVPRHDLP